MASIYRRKNKDGKTGRWKAVIRIKGHPSLSATFDRKKEAEDWAHQAERKIKMGKYKFAQRKKDYTYSELVDRFINDGIMDHHRSSKDTLCHLRFWKSRLGSYALIHLTPEIIAKERKYLLEEPCKTKTGKRSNETANRYAATLSTSLSYAVKQLRWIDDNPCFNLVKLKEASGRDRVLSIEESRRLLSACKNSNNPYLYCIVLFALTTGARKSEILSLTWTNVDFENRIAHLKYTKNKKPRSIPLIDEVLKELKRLYTARNLNKP